VYIDNIEILENKKYYLNKTYHTVEIFIKNKKIENKFLVDKQGVYFISENKVYYINNKYKIIK
jgi:hypothetical protein